jgi:hypothetical protein
MYESNDGNAFPEQRGSAIICLIRLLSTRIIRDQAAAETVTVALNRLFSGAENVSRRKPST